MGRSYKQINTSRDITLFGRIARQCHGLENKSNVLAVVRIPSLLTFFLFLTFLIITKCNNMVFLPHLISNMVFFPCLNKIYELKLHTL